jgi:hypothetical protein
MPPNKPTMGSSAPAVTHDVALMSSSLPVGAVSSAKLGLPQVDAPSRGLATCNPARHVTPPSVPAGTSKQVLNCR